MPSKVPRSLRAEAVVIRHSDWGEADRLIGLYTRELGRVRAIAKGVRKPRSRKAGHLEPFTRVSLLLARGRDLYIITQAETVDAHLSLRENLERVGQAYYVLELLDRFTPEEDENASLYRLLTDTLSRLGRAADPALVVRYYEIRLLDLVGFRPQLVRCVEGGEEIRPQAQFFSPALGGVVCPACGARTPGGRPISVDALRYLRHFQRGSYAEAARARIPPGVHRELEDLMQYYLTYLLERSLNTPAFLRQVRRENEPPIQAGGIPPKSPAVARELSPKQDQNPGDQGKQVQEHAAGGEADVEQR